MAATGGPAIGRHARRGPLPTATTMPQAALGVTARSALATGPYFPARRNRSGLACRPSRPRASTAVRPSARAYAARGAHRVRALHGLWRGPVSAGGGDSAAASFAEFTGTAVMFLIRQSSILARSDLDIVSGSVRALHRDSRHSNRSRGVESTTFVLFPSASSGCRCRRLGSLHDNRLTWGSALLQSP
jgi:hypothetical protein